MAYHNTQPTFPLASAANEEELLQNHQASVAQFCHEQHLTVGSVEERDQNTRNEHKIFPDPEVHDEVQTCLHSWFNYFANAEVTSATADCSMYSPRYMPVRNGTAFKRFPPAFFHSPFPGVSPSPIDNPKPPSYYPTPQNSWVPDPISYSPCSIGWPSDAADETFRKRSRELKLPITDEQDDVYSSRFGATPSKLPRIPSLLMPESAFFVNSSSMGGIQESCCKMAGDAAPVVDIYVPSVCECGTAIVGVWYLNRPHYAHWFRHPRYAALRCMLEQNRCKNKYRPVCGIHSSVGLTPPAAKVSSAKDPHEYGSRAADNGTGAPVISEDDFAAVMSPEDLLAPKFMSLMCMFQFVKHLDAVGIMYPTAVQAGSSAPPLMKLDHVKISAHIDCERSKGFVQYRWYGADANELADDLSSGDKSSKKAVGCCCIGHWKRKPPGLGPSKSTSQLLVDAILNVKDVFSPFELDCNRPASIGLFDVPNISVIDWESLDHSVWMTCKSLLLLPPEVIEASMKIPFSKDKHASHDGSVYCGKHCDIKRPTDKDKKGSSYAACHVESCDSYPATATFPLSDSSVAVVHDVANLAVQNFK